MNKGALLDAILTLGSSKNRTIHNMTEPIFITKLNPNMSILNSTSPQPDLKNTATPASPNIRRSAKKGTGSEKERKSNPNQFA